MAGAQRSGARWIALLLGVALVASAVVAYALIKVTAPGPGGGQAVASTQGTVTASLPVSPADVTVSSTRTATSATVPAETSSAQAPTPTAPATSVYGAAESGAPGSGSPGSAASGAPSTAVTSAPAPVPSGSASPETDAVTTQTSTLPGSGVTLPAAWSGTATITVRVLGKCATRTPSVYRSAPADLALDLTQNEVVAASPTATSQVPDNQPALTLGVNTSAVPSIAVLSSAVDETGTFHRYWRITLTPEAGRTRIDGVMLAQPSGTANPNTLGDTETSLQPCEGPGTVGLPRVLAAGSTLSGWVDPAEAHLTLHATTTDDKRAVTVQISAQRKQ